MIEINEHCDSLKSPINLFSRSEILLNPSVVPNSSGLYAWYFRSLPSDFSASKCVTKNDCYLLYIGISPEKVTSTQNLRKRILTHLRGNAEGSTLRRTLGILLSKKSGFPLRRVGSGNRMTFTHSGEQWLDDWMDDNAFVCWEEHPEPWRIEKEIFLRTYLPLNLKGNNHNNYYLTLKSFRKTALAQARSEPIALEENRRKAEFQTDSERLVD
ncbi:GIY-YIG nuclease family protein [Mesorhizobium sp. LjRoot246]|uniref:GIY-YIG nuclease family protein n=1 Tax=Mesorhizobium sp. LjRoot246 TaxID=3342294 RepID=UPI003ECF255D